MEVGKKVFFSSGKYKGKKGVLSGSTEHMYKVQLDDTIVRVPKKSVEEDTATTKTMGFDCKDEELSCISEPPDFSCDSAGSLNEKPNVCALPDSSCDSCPTSASDVSEPPETHGDSNPAYNAVLCPFRNILPGFEMEKVEVRAKSKKTPETHFIAEWCKMRGFSCKPVFDVPVTNQIEKLPCCFSVQDAAEGKQSTAELLCGKVHSKGKAFHGRIEKVYRMIYVCSQAGVNTVRDELESIADFRGHQSSVRKMASRLSLFQSTGEAFSLKAENFELFDEPVDKATGDSMHDGCGFIPEDLLFHWFGGGTGTLARLRKIIDDEGLAVKKSVNTKKNRTLADIAREIDEFREKDRGPVISEVMTHVAVQVRVFGPRIGIAKGMFMRKPGIRRIQLPHSMVKVGPSKVSKEDWVICIVSQKYPSKTSLDLVKSFAGSPPHGFAAKMLSTMMIRLWRCLGVPENICSTYQRKRDPENMTYAWMAGVADPTGEIPAGHIFVSGSTGDIGALKSVFITRSPCVRPEDGRLLPILTGCPKTMALSSWTWLSRLPFGMVIFSACGAGPPLPASVADGDLDGDLYLVCWDPDIINNITPRDPSASKDKKYPALLAEDKVPIQVDGDWLSQMQRHMTNPMVLREQDLVGKLYSAMEKIADADGLDHPNAVALASAYVQALEREKHGGAIELPLYLQDKFKLAVVH